MARKKKSEEDKLLSYRDCWHCVNCMCDSGCGYRCRKTGDVLPHEKIMDRTDCLNYRLDDHVVMGNCGMLK